MTFLDPALTRFAIYVGDATTFRSRLVELRTSAGIPVRDTTGASLLDPFPIGDATLLEMVFEKPDGTVSALPAFLTTDGTDGLLEASVLSTFLDQAGTWRRQARVTKPGSPGRVFRGRVREFKVLAGVG